MRSLTISESHFARFLIHDNMKFYINENRFTAKEDAIWRPNVITNPEINLSVNYTVLLHVFAIQCATSGKVTPVWGQLPG